MEAPGFCTLLYIMFTLPEQRGLKSLPPANWLMAGLFV
jgi:3-oxo-5-alpha-steroid 4-dehydrogenase 1